MGLNSVQVWCGVVWCVVVVEVEVEGDADDAISAVNSFSFTSHWSLNKQLNARNNWQVASVNL